MNTRTHTKSGFTLVETLVVAAVTALVFIAVSKYEADTISFNRSLNSTLTS